MPEIAVPTPHIADPRRITRQSPALRSILRDATAAEHARLDARLGAFDLRTVGGYRKFLEINAAALLPLERALVRAGVRDVLPDWDHRARSKSILCDLARLGGTPRCLTAPPCSAPSMFSKDRALGRPICSGKSGNAAMPSCPVTRRS